jgi:hypothetical protein
MSVQRSELSCFQKFLSCFCCCKSAPSRNTDLSDRTTSVAQRSINSPDASRRPLLEEKGGDEVVSYGTSGDMTAAVRVANGALRQSGDLHGSLPLVGTPPRLSRTPFTYSSPLLASPVRTPVRSAPSPQVQEFRGEARRFLTSSPNPRSAYPEFLQTAETRFPELPREDLQSLVIDEYNQMHRRYPVSAPTGSPMAQRFGKEIAIQNCIEKVRKLRGIFGQDGAIHAEWTRHIQANKCQLGLLLRMSKCIAGEGVDLTASEEREIANVRPDSHSVLTDLERIKAGILSKVSGMDEAAVLERMRTAHSEHMPLVEEYEELERAKGQYLAKKNELDAEYVGLGGRFFNPDTDFDKETSQYRVAADSKIDRIQKGLQ